MQAEQIEDGKERKKAFRQIKKELDTTPELKKQSFIRPWRSMKS
jgi:hypothetical protein